MLSESALAHIRASVPALQTHGEAITRYFYARLFEAHPALRSVFPAARQADGTQSRALAGALLAYAANIDRPAVLAPAIAHIAQRHVQWHVQPEQYPIVGEQLIAALAHVLGDAATEPLLNAWRDAYGILADQLIAAEAALYAQTNATRTG